VQPFKRRTTLIALLAAGISAACSSNNGTDSGMPADAVDVARTDTGVDAPVDVPRTDTGVDAAVDAAPDIAPIDTGVDVPADVQPDVAPTDSGVDAAVDVTPDITPIDTGVDAPADVSPVDTGVDVSVDVPIVVGPPAQVHGSIGTLGARSAGAASFRLVDDGFESGARQCAGSFCITGSITP